MAVSAALRMTKWMLDLSTRLVKARVRLHNAEIIEPDMAIIFVANHFTRLETLLLPYIIHQHTGLEPWSLAAAELFQGRIGQYLKATGAVSTEEPDRDKIIIRSLLRGDHCWVIFPEGAMNKDKRSLGADGRFEVFDGVQRRPPHTGAAALALRTAYYRAKFRCLHDRNSAADWARALEMFGLDSIEEVVSRRTVVIPVNITYYPIRARDNIFLRAARRMTPNLSDRALAELSVEGTVLSEDTDIDVRLGDPIDVGKFLDTPEYGPVMACSLHDLEDLETNPRDAFQDAARVLTERFMTAIYSGATINFDHLFSGILRHQPEGRLFNERGYRERIYLSSLQMQKKTRNMHPRLREQCKALLDDEPHQAFQGFLDLALQKRYLIATEWGYRKAPRNIHPEPDFHAMPTEAIPEVIANELEAARALYPITRYAAWAPDFVVKAFLRRHLLLEDQREFEEDYARFYAPQQCKPPNVGKPFLLCPWRIRGGVVLAHGYMAAPLEVRALAEHLYRRGYAVYGVRLRGHGTTPEDLGRREWDAWYASLSRGYAIMRTLTDNVVIGGFSTGGCLALLAAARKKQSIEAVFSICAPLYVRNYSIRLVPSIISLNALLKRFGQSQLAWEYVENDPENKHINYTRNPLTGVRQLTAVMNATAEVLGDIEMPALVIQASKDPTVDPSSGPDIFGHLGSRQKQLTLFERERHGIINGEGSPEVFTQVEQFIIRTTHQAASRKYWLFGRRIGQFVSRSLALMWGRPPLPEDGASASEGPPELKNN